MLSVWSSVNYFTASDPVLLKWPLLASPPCCLLSQQSITVESITFPQPPLENTEWPERKRLSGAPGAINQLLVTQRWQGQAQGWHCHSGFKPPTHWLTDTYCSQILDTRLYSVLFLLGYSGVLGVPQRSKIIISMRRFNSAVDHLKSTNVQQSGPAFTAKAILFFSFFRQMNSCIRNICKT